MLTTELSFFIASFVALFTIINPFNAASVLISLTPHKSIEERKIIAQKAALTAAFLLIIFSVAGKFILGLFSITIDAFRIGGGILIFSLGYKMLNSKRKYFHSEHEEKHAREKEDISIIPLAIPFMAGPGALTTAIVLMTQAKDVPMNQASVILGIIIVSFICYYILSRAHIIEDYLNITARRIITTIMGLLVLVIGIQFIINGVTNIVGGWLLPLI